MKRIKIMLMSMLLLAVVGGALAFKAKFERNYCTRQPNGSGQCPATGFCNENPAANVTLATTAAIPIVCTSVVPAGGDCTEVTCPNRVRLTTDL